MSVASLNPGDLSGSHVKIGAASHLGRNLGMVIGAALLGGVIFGFYRYSSGQDNAQLANLDSFRAALAQKCDAPAWRGEVSPMLRDTYLNSAKLRDTVEKQRALLGGTTSCEDVIKALRAADFPIPAASTAAAAQ